MQAPPDCPFRHSPRCWTRILPFSKDLQSWWYLCCCPTWGGFIPTTTGRDKGHGDAVLQVFWLEAVIRACNNGRLTSDLVGFLGFDVPSSLPHFPYLACYCGGITQTNFPRAFCAHLLGNISSKVSPEKFRGYDLPHLYCYSSVSYSGRAAEWFPASAHRGRREQAAPPHLKLVSPIIVSLLPQTLHRRNLHPASFKRGTRRSKDGPA